MMKLSVQTALAAAILLAGCGRAGIDETAPAEAPGMGMGMGRGMAARHGAPIPAAYADMTNPVSAEAESLARGAEIFTTNCATCHGDGGMGDGPAGVSLDPRPVPVARTSQMMGDAYLFWRISEGGVPFNTAMPAWKATLDEQARWDVINYVRALGRGVVEPAGTVGGAAPSDQAEAEHMDEMLAQAVDQGLITAAEAETFKTVHGAIQDYRTAHPPVPGGASPAEVEAATLAELIQAATITPAQADMFQSVHDRLSEAGLME